MTQLERWLRKALTELNLGFSHYGAYQCAEQGGKVILGRHVEVYFNVSRVRRADQERVARVFRRYWHRNTQRYRSERCSVQGWPDVRSSLTLTY